MARSSSLRAALTDTSDEPDAILCAPIAGEVRPLIGDGADIGVVISSSEQQDVRAPVAGRIAFADTAAGIFLIDAGDGVEVEVFVKPLTDVSPASVLTIGMTSGSLVEAGDEIAACEAGGFAVEVRLSEACGGAGVTARYRERERVRAGQPLLEVTGISPE